MPMQMTNEEIVRSYNEAANKSKQIKVLADLNCCSPGEIKTVLAEAGVAGVKMPERVRQRKPEAGGRQAARAVVDAGGGNDASRSPAPAAGELSVYDRIETILAALPEDATEYARNNAYNLVVALFSGYVEGRIGKGARNGT